MVADPSLRRRPVDPTQAEAYRRQGWWSGRPFAHELDEVLRARAGGVVHVLRADGTLGRHLVADVHHAAQVVAAFVRSDLADDLDPVWVRSTNSIECMVVLLGVLLSGAPLLPVSGRSTEAELERVRGYVGRAALLDLTPHPLEIATPADGCGPDAVRAYLDEGGRTMATAHVDVAPDDPLLVGLTAGTEGAPKAVVHSNDSFGCEVRQLSSSYPAVADEWLVPSPICHAIGMLSMLTPLWRGRDVHIMEVWNPARAVAHMRATGANCGSVSGYFAEGVLAVDGFGADDARLMRFAGFGGSATSAEVARRLDDLGVHVYRMYGSTEHPSVTCSAGLDTARRLTTEGVPLDGAELRVVGGEDGFGRLETRGPDACAGMLLPAGSTWEPFTEDGWVWTGDHARIGEDGSVEGVTRLAETIDRQGTMVSPSEVEEALASLIAGEFAVVGTPATRASAGDEVVLCVAGSAACELGAVRSALTAAGLAADKHPTRVAVVDRLPRNETGKVDRRALRATLVGGGS